MDMITIMNTIIANGSAEFTARIPAATATNLTAVGNAILEYPSSTEEFLNLLVNRIAMVIVDTRVYNNPLALLKKGSIPLGDGVQDIYVNPAKATKFDSTGATLLAQTRPDVKVIYHTMNREDQYQVSFTKKGLKQAFVSYADMGNLLTGVINSLYSGDSMDEFILTKNLIGGAITDNKIINVEVPTIDSADGAKALVKAIKNASSLFVYASSNFNSYLTAQPAIGGDLIPVITWTPKEDQIILIRSDVMNEISVEVLASAFNLDKVSFLRQVVEVDTFGSATKTLAVLADKSYFKIYDNEKSVENFYNSKNMTTTFFLNHWQTYSLCLYANAVTFSTL